MNVSHELAAIVAGAGDNWGHGHWWVWAPLVWAVWIVVTAAVVWVIVRRIRPSERSGVERAREILAERYARGELTGDEFRERLEGLR